MLMVSFKVFLVIPSGENKIQTKYLCFPYDRYCISENSCSVTFSTSPSNLTFSTLFCKGWLEIIVIYQEEVRKEGGPYIINNQSKTSREGRKVRWTKQNSEASLCPPSYMNHFSISHIIYHSNEQRAPGLTNAVTFLIAPLKYLNILQDKKCDQRTKCIRSQTQYTMVTDFGLTLTVN